MPPIPTPTSTTTSFTLHLPTGQATFSFPPSPTNPSQIGTRTRISIPAGSAWMPGPHWHEHYVEHVRVLKGRAKLVVSGVESTRGPGDGVVTFEKFVVHDFGRADGGKALKDGGEEGVVEVEEWTEPEDGFKQVFFYNLLSPMIDPNLGSATPTTSPNITFPLVLQLLAAIPHLDNFVDPLPFLPHNLPVLGGFLFGVKYVLTHLIYMAGSAVGRGMGYQRWVREYTPREFWEVAERGGVVGKGKGE